MASTKGAAAYASQADLLPPIPLTMMMKSGELRLAGQRLRFTDTKHELLVDAPVAELHSLERAVIGIHIWHGPKRYRFALGSRDRRTQSIAEVEAITEEWITILQPLIGTPPAGLTVRKPWPRWAWMLSVVALSAFFVAAVVVLVRLKN
ncbi:MAG: hypothetical protein JWM34_1853 [Ilumatobacteraceae bacterium]|nr:hypothetical protein [Ilumatobacteraceae bacterium]